jgi:hypothetical protein
VEGIHATCIQILFEKLKIYECHKYFVLNASIHAGHRNDLPSFNLAVLFSNGSKACPYEYS